MYIRRASRVYKGTTYFNYLLVESVATPKGPRQKVVCSLGDLRPRPKHEWVALAHKLQSALGGQEPLFRSANAVAATSSKKRLAVLVVDDNPIMRLGLAVIIGGQPDMIVCAQASSGDEAVQLYREHRPGVTLMDLRLPGGMSGIHALHAIRELRTHTEVRAMAHITGGGVVDNVPRVLPEGLAATVDRATWTVPPVFTAIQRAGSVHLEEMWRTFNMGVGMVVIVPPDVPTIASAAGIPVWRIGEVVPQSGTRRVILR